MHLHHLGSIRLNHSTELSETPCAVRARRMDSCETVSKALEQSSANIASNLPEPLPNHLTASSTVCSTARQVSLLLRNPCYLSKWWLSSRKSRSCEPTSAAAQRILIGRYIAVSLLLPLFLYTGSTRALTHSPGTRCSWMDVLIMFDSGVATTDSACCKTRGGMRSIPVALLVTMFCRAIFTASTDTCWISKDGHVVVSSAGCADSICS